MGVRFGLEVLRVAREEVANRAEYVAAMGRFAPELQRFCRALARVDERFAELKRARSRLAFADLPPERATAQICKDSYVTSLTGLTPGNRWVRLSAESGVGPVDTGGVRLSADDAFWQDEALIRRVAAAMIDFWQADQACVYTLRLPDTDWRADQPWYFWLDWRRTADTPTLMPNVRASGEPAVVQAWHGGVERLWPEHAPWEHVPPPRAAGPA